jgi:hypothetical protein
MSIEAVSLVLNHSKAHGRAKLVLIGIANHMGDQGAWPSIETLAKYANASERSVKRDIQELVDLGELVVHYQAAPINSQYKTNLYWITISGVTDSVSGVTTQVSRGDRLGKSGVTPVGTQNINITIKEPSIEVKASRIPKDFKPTDENIVWANENHPLIDLAKATENFVDYWETKPSNATKLDWQKTWRVWIRNTKPDRVSRKVENDFDALRKWAKEQDEQNEQN